MSAEVLADTVPEQYFTDPEAIDGGEQLVDAFGVLITKLKQEHVGPGIIDDLAHFDLVHGELPTEIKIGENKSIRVYEINNDEESVFIAMTNRATDGTVGFSYNTNKGSLKAAGIIESTVELWGTK